ncbi:DUF3040 domain-containing protein [Arthrobacter sp. B1805]|uniref:DUF3040 domain-containing protein n=1 Tax=Arthrobacter sp. B1805 TaxID=2058892 RepID=UPI0015E34559
MALSAEEHRKWVELQHQLAAEAPGLAKLTTGRRAGVVVGFFVVLVAFTAVIFAVVVKIPLIGVLGFILMIIGGTRFRPFSLMNQRPRGSARTGGGVTR